MQKILAWLLGLVKKKRHVPIGAIYEAIGPTKAAALPGFHSLTGADITGKFGGKGKITCWKVFEQLGNDSGNEMVHALTQLGAAETISELTTSALEAFVCKLYINGTKLTSVADARWWLFKRKQAQAENMPPTRDALLPALQRAHYQAMIWYNDIVANPEIPSPQSYGWNLVDGTFKEVMTSLPPAPEAITQLVKCGCKATHCSTNQCKCRKNGLLCTEFCSCSEEDEPCDNAEEDEDLETDESSDEDI